MLPLGEFIDLQLGEFIDQLEQAWRGFQNFPFEDVTKPLPNLIANRATMNVVKP
jgi:hypothetical protein